MLFNSFLFFFLLIFSSIIFFIKNLYIIGLLLILSIFLCFIFKVKLPIYLPFLFLLTINFFINFLLSDLINAILVTTRIFLMFTVVNLIIKKIGIYNLSQVFKTIFKSKELALIVAICLSFIPIMTKEIHEIKKSLKTKNYEINLKNILRRPSIFVITFFTNLFKRVDEMEKVLISKGIDE